jgi:hypothetical protein
MNNCDKRAIANFCNNKDVRLVQLRRQAAGVRGTNLYDRPIVQMCSECRKSNRGMFKMVAAPIAA